MRHMLENGIIKTTGQQGTWRVTWLETGQKSKPRGMAAIPVGPHPKDARLHEAKQFLRRRHSNVYDCRITGGPADRVWVSGIGAITHDQVYELAKKSGWAG